MRKLITIVFLVIDIYSFGQPTLDTKYSSDVCACLDSIKAKGINEQNFSDCFQKAAMQNSGLILKETKQEYGDTSEESAYKFGKELAERISITLVKNCRTYFIITDSMRYDDYKNLNEDSIKFQLKDMEETEVSKQNDEFFSNKAMLYFELKMYDSSFTNVEKALTINSDNIQGLYLKGWLNEIKGNYDDAILLYDKVAELTQVKSFYIFSEIAKRKKTGM
ncbi:MAG TPA: hypothetical protein VFI29_21270 [Hanamia sp.]|nr:hypothetical protein [Hanamia sp.]